MIKDNPKKIFFILPTLSGGGAEKVILTITNILGSKYTHIYEIVLIVLVADGEYVDNIPPHVRMVDLKSPRARKAILKLWRLCVREKPDMVVSTMQATTLFYFVRTFLFKKPIWLSRLENPYSFDVEHLSTVIKFLYVRALKKCHGVISLGADMTSDLIQHTGVSKNNVFEIVNPIDVASVRKLSNEGLLYTLEKPAVVMCGRLVEQKGYDFAIQMMSLIKQEGKICYLYVLGTGPLELSLKELVKEHNIESQVSFLGFQSNPFPYFKQADLFLLTSRYEGFGNVLVEALAAGVPIVSFDSPTGPRDILQNGSIGTILPVGDITGLVREVVRILDLDSNKKNILIEKGQERANDFSAEKVCAEYNELFKKLLYV